MINLKAADSCGSRRGTRIPMRGLAAEGHRFGSHGEPLVEQAALVRLEVGESDVREPLDREHTAHRLTHQREHPARASTQCEGVHEGYEPGADGCSTMEESPAARIAS